MKYRLIDTPGFPVKKASELKEGDGDVVYIHHNGNMYSAIERDGTWWPAYRNEYNPTGLVARAFEVVQDEWTWEYHGCDFYGIYHNGKYVGTLLTKQAAAEYCKWKNGGNDGK